MHGRGVLRAFVSRPVGAGTEMLAARDEIVHADERLVGHLG
jgi:hypothetical protein